jgi:hypothetical protein
MRDIRQTGGNLPMNAGVRMTSALSARWMRLIGSVKSSIAREIDIGVFLPADRQSSSCRSGRMKNQGVRPQ